VPDYATATRFGNLLTTHKAVGRMLCYYFDVEGNIIHSDTDFSIQIPLATLSRCPNVVAVCSAALQPKALLGALRSGLFMNVIASESLIKKTLELH
jgi:DNA-binding transcriptional regulator LsrR (DeoR family)